VIELYKLHPTNFFAYRKLHGHCPPLPCGVDCVPFRAADHPEVEREFARRIAALPAEHQPFALGIYANPIVSKLEYANRPERVGAAC
jgi:hypothetical protein